jgi:hypothetical protein
MSSRLRVRYRLPGCATNKMRMINPHQTIRDVISTIAKLDRVHVGEMSLDGCALAGDECFYDYCDPPDQLFVLSKARSADPTSNPRARVPVRARDPRRTPPGASDDDQYATVGDDDSNLIAFDSYRFLGCSHRYFEQLRADPSDRDLRLDGSFERDSVV